MKKFIFGVLTYNQEKYILETLESIKLQKINYGAEIDVSLIIIDDKSSDGTVKAIEEWLGRNKEYFVHVEFIANQENKGTVANFCTILHKVQNEDFKIIAGDDLFGNTNLFAQYSDLDEKKLKSYVRIELNNGRILFHEKYLIDFYYHKLHNKKEGYHLKNFRKGKYLHTPSTLFSKQLFLNADCEKTLEGFRLFEDDPTWYSMIKHEKDLEVDFVEEEIVLYRVHDKSISNVPNPVFRDEMKKLKKMYCDDTKGLEHLYHSIKMFTHLPRYANPGLYVDKLNHLYRKRICSRDEGYQKFRNKMQQRVEIEQKYYDAIRKSIP